MEIILYLLFWASLLVLYLFAFPIVMLVTSYNYNNENVKNVINFGVLGFFIGASQLALLYQLIDLPILKQIRKIEGKNRGLIDSSRFIIVKKRRIMSILIISVSVQLILGQVSNAINQESSALSIIITAFINVMVNAMSWSLILLF